MNRRILLLALCLAALPARAETVVGSRTFLAGIDGVPIGATTPSTGAFTDLTGTTLFLSNGTDNGSLSRVDETWNFASALGGATGTTLNAGWGKFFHGVQLWEGNTNFEFVTLEVADHSGVPAFRSFSDTDGPMRMWAKSLLVVDDAAGSEGEITLSDSFYTLNDANSNPAGINVGAIAATSVNSSNAIDLGSTSALTWTSRMRLDSTADGYLRARKNGGTALWEFRQRAAGTGAVPATYLTFPTSHNSAAPWCIGVNSSSFAGPANETDATLLIGFNMDPLGNKIVATGGVGGGRTQGLMFEHAYYAGVGNPNSILDEFHYDCEGDSGNFERVWHQNWAPSANAGLGSFVTYWKGAFNVYATNGGQNFTGGYTLIANDQIQLAKNGVLKILKQDNATAVTAVSLDTSDRIQLGAPLVMNTNAIRLDGNLDNSLARPAASATPVPGEIWGYSRQTPANNDGFLRISAGGGTTPLTYKSFIDLSGFSSVADMDSNILLSAGGQPTLKILGTGGGPGPRVRFQYSPTVYSVFMAGSAGDLTLSPSSNGTAAFNFTKADQTTSVMKVDTTNRRVMFGGAASGGGTIDVASTVTTNGQTGIENTVTVSPADANLQYGFRNDVTQTGGGTTGNNVVGIANSVTQSGGTRAAIMYGTMSTLNNSSGGSVGIGKAYLSNPSATSASSRWGDFYHYTLSDVFLNSTATVGNQYGFYCPALAAGGTSNYGFYSVSAPSFFGGDVQLSKTITAGGTTGAQTINKSSGSVNFAAAAASLVVTNSLVTANSVIVATIGTHDATMTSVQVVAAAGSFTIWPNAVPTAETRVNFLIVN
jgi:hypothetical protein